MKGCEPAIVAGVERLQEVVALAAAHFANDDPVGTEAQTQRDEQLRGDVRVRVGEQANAVRDLNLQLHRVFNGDHALVFRDDANKCVKKRRLARRSAARDEHVLA